MPGHFGKQNGAALVVSLLFLLVMTVSGVTGMQVSTMEEKMSGNMRDRNLAFQSAESALRAGEAFMIANPAPAFTDSAGLYTPSVVTQPNYADVLGESDWADPARVKIYTSGTNGVYLTGLAAQPAYIVEQMPATTAADPDGCLDPSNPCPEQTINWFRITSRGVGGSANAVVMLQSIFRR